MIQIKFGIILVVGFNLGFFSFKALVKEAEDTNGHVVAGPNSLSESEKWRLYDPDPNHIWNRLYRSLYMRLGPDGREYGYDELDPLLWPSTKYLLVAWLISRQSQCSMSSSPLVQKN